MSDFTPGPWSKHPMLSPSENARGFRIMAHDGIDGQMWVADVSPVLKDERGDASDEGRANAALIQAAPLMFEALSELLAERKGGAMHDALPDTFGTELAREALAVAVKK